MILRRHVVGKRVAAGSSLQDGPDRSVGPVSFCPEFQNFRPPPRSKSPFSPRFRNETGNAAWLMFAANFLFRSGDCRWALDPLTLAGRLGRALEPLSRLAGFDWRDNVALFGGWAAKEVIVSTMGIAYSMGAEPTPQTLNDGGGLPLVQALRNDPRWNPLRAFALIVFVMLYAPCLVTLVAIRRESGSWKWPLFSTVYSTTIASVMATIITRVGLILGLGV